MPPLEPSNAPRPIQEIVEHVGLYPIEAYHFIQQGLGYTVEKLHGPVEKADPTRSRHVSGQQLSEGLRDFALLQWGLLARVVLERWNITCTYDFGQIVFALIEGGRMQRTDEDTLEDFRNVFDFRTAFESNYQIACKT